MRITNLTKRFATLVALILMAGFSAFAQNPKVEQVMAEMVKKYENTKGVDCFTAVKGQGLEIMKLALRGKMGKDFMKGVTSITIIHYSDASEAVCQELRKDLDVFTSLLEEFNWKEDKDNKEAAGNSYTRCFACTSAAAEGTLSDFVIAIEAEGAKTIMYMNGVITVK